MPIPNPEAIYIIPTGYDRADGLGDNVGTVAPPFKIIVNGDPVATVDDVSIDFNEKPDSPEIERAEQQTVQHVFTTDWVNAKELIRFLYRGIIMVDSDGGQWKILSATCKHGRGEEAVISVTSEALFSDVPPDEFDCTPIELGINIIKYPRYLYALVQQPGDSAAEVDAKQTIVRLLQEYIAAPTEPQKTGYLNGLLIVSGDDPTVRLAKAAAQEIVQKLWLQEDSPYIVAYQVTWKQYFYSPQLLNPGSYKEDPIYEANPGLPPYFCALDQNFPSNGTIFDAMYLINPQCYAQPDDTQEISWLRKADQQVFQRTLFGLTSTWIGSPIGNWDRQIYSNERRPTTWIPSENPNPFQLFQSQSLTV